LRSPTSRIPATGRCLAVGDRARRDLDRDRRAGAVGDFGVEPQLALAEQPVDHVGIADER
jgi:hypothetical protein